MLSERDVRIVDAPAVVERCDALKQVSDRLGLVVMVELLIRGADQCRCRMG